MKIINILSITVLTLSSITGPSALADRMADTSPENASIKVAAIPAKPAAKGETGIASKYWQPQRIACGGGQFNPKAMTAAHKTLPCGTKVKVTNLRNGRTVVVTINDRGPYVKGRIIDLSLAAANKIGMGGLAKVRVERVSN